MEATRRLKLVHESDAADFDSVRVTLFTDGSHVYGWYISPVIAISMRDGYVPKSANLIASCAVLRAIALADRLEVDVCIIDPENLWERAWGDLDGG